MSEAFEWRPAPGKTDDDPMCVNYECPSAFSCRRFSHEPWQFGGGPTIFIDPRPALLDGLLCESFDPDTPNPGKRPKPQANPLHTEGVSYE